MTDDSRHAVTRRVTLVGALVNCLLAALQISVGLLGKSQALLADGIHTLSDLATDFIVLFAARSAARDADKSHPYGHGRIETLASMALGGALVAVGIGIGYRGIDSILHPTGLDPEPIALAFAFVAIFAKEGLYRYTLRAARATHSALLESNAWHHRSDALSSIVVVIGISTQLMGVPYMDAVAAIIVAVMVCRIGIRLVQSALAELIDTSLDAELVSDLRATMTSDSSVTGVHNLRSRSMGGLGYVDAHIEVDSDLTVSEAHYIAHRIEHKVKKAFPQIVDVQVHIDPLEDHVRESLLARLPDRPAIERDLAAAWADTAVGEQVLQTRLHYLDKLIEIDLVLPVALAGVEHRDAVAQLRERARGLDYVGRVNLYFAD